MAMDTLSFKFAMENMQKAIRAMIGELDGVTARVNEGADIVGQKKPEMVLGVQQSVLALEDAIVRLRDAANASEGII